MRAPRKSAATRRAEMIAAALTLADRIGPDRLTTADVAQAVGMTQPALFRHFPSKADLWVAVAQQIAADTRSDWDRAALPDPAASLRALVAAQLRRIETTPALPAILFSRELTVENPGLRTVFQELHADFIRRLMRECTRLPGTTPPADAALLLVSLIQGLTLRWSLGMRNIPLTTEGLRLLDLQLDLIQGKAPQ